MITVYHNARCSKSRACLLLLAEADAAFETVEYLKTPLSLKQLKSLRSKLRLPAMGMVRQNEPEWRPYKDLELTEDEVLQLLVRHPVLIERPIAVKGNRAVIARPPENVLALL